MKWRIIDSEPAPAQVNMEADRQLLEGLGDQPILHLYRWERPAATHGHFTDPSKYLQKNDLDIARRPTGGGILLHLWDLAFSLLLPASHPAFSTNTLANYQWVNGQVATALLKTLQAPLDLQLLPQEPEGIRDFCMAKPTIYDIVVGSRKVGGAAQRRKKQGLLHQGTISLVPPTPGMLERLFQPNSPIPEAMHKTTYAVLPPETTKHELEEARQELRHQLAQVFTREEGIDA